MSEDAAHLVDDVSPEVPVPRWVLSFPLRIRCLLAYDPILCCAVRRVLVRAVQGFLEREARDQGHTGARAGAVVFVQRFGSALNRNQPDEPFFAEPCAASVQRCIALGAKSEAAIERIGRRRGGDLPLFMPGELRCDLDGFRMGPLRLVLKSIEGFAIHDPHDGL